MRENADHGRDYVALQRIDVLARACLRDGGQVGQVVFAGRAPRNGEKRAARRRALLMGVHQLACWFHCPCACAW